MAQGPEMEQKLLLTPAAQSTANLHNTVHINSISVSYFCARNSQMPFLIVTWKICRFWPSTVTSHLIGIKSAPNQTL